MVYRIFVEKKAELAHEAKSLCSELVNLLGINSGKLTIEVRACVHSHNYLFK